ncbi:MAG: hypothetical protein GY780_19260, partial [bacterium]|nr:hypothetical protein [bacterium]
MTKIALIFLTMVTLVLVISACQEEVSLPEAPNEIVDSLIPDKALPGFGCNFDQQLTQEYLEARWLEGQDLDWQNFESITFNVDPNTNFDQCAELGSYPIGSLVPYQICLSIPAGSLPPIGRGGPPQYTIKVVVPPGDYEGDASGFRIFVENSAEDIILTAPITVTIPYFPWYEPGQLLHQYYVEKIGEDPDDEYIYNFLEHYEMPVSSVIMDFQINFLPADPDLAGGDGGFPT